jgi:Flp pilus assembly pilin Flp
MQRILLNFYEKALAFRRSSAGATAIEYALIASGIGMSLIAVFFLTGGSLGSMWSRIFSQLSSYLAVS